MGLFGKGDRTARALPEAAPPVLSSGPEGFIDLVDAERIAGWVWDPSAPHRRLVVEARVGDRVEVALADRERADLRAAGKGDGRHGFEIRLALDGPEAEAVQVREVASGRELAGSPVRFDLAGLLAGPTGHGRLDLLRDEARRALIRLEGGGR